ncbi:MAG TPA: cobyric acid synthase [Aquabacterium sp.]|nr:cobyric acid synthase [Aquabacterium sp.]
MSARAVMVLGTTSGAGKSWLATAVCRWAARRGLRVVPYKAQNMSNNARVVATRDGGWGEIGSAQYFQALAARAQPDVRMNPILLKPESDTGSQVVVCGRVHQAYSTMPWRERSEQLWPHARQALQELLDENDLVVIEGAGSPAEINLHQSDYVNMRTALEASAQCVVVTDIDRGGAFAHLFGTHQLLPEHERALIRGFILNRFRGDPTLLSPGPEQLQALTGVPTVAVLPYWRDHGLADEDGLDGGRWLQSKSQSTGPRITIAVIAYPQISNLDEFQSLRHLSNVDLIWARHPQDLLSVDWIILPGSKRSQSDLTWLRQQGLDEPIRSHAYSGRPILGICGGLQMLGLTLEDPHGVDGGLMAQPGLGLLPIRTVFDPVKVVRPARMRFADSLTSAWSCWRSIEWSGYEIHQGRTEWMSEEGVHALVRDDGHPLGWAHGQTMGIYAHGLFESSEILRAWIGSDCQTWDQVFDGLADFIDTHFQKDFLSQWLLR